MGRTGSGVFQRIIDDLPQSIEDELAIPKHRLLLSGAGNTQARFGLLRFQCLNGLVNHVGEPQKLVFGRDGGGVELRGSEKLRGDIAQLLRLLVQKVHEQLLRFRKAPERY